MNSSTTDYKLLDDKGNTLLYYLNEKNQKIKVANFGLECVEIINTNETQDKIYKYKILPKPIIKPYTIELQSNRDITQKIITEILGINYIIYNIKEFTSYLAKKTNEYIYKNLNENYIKDKDYKSIKENDIKIAKDFIIKLYNLINNEKKLKEYINTDSYNSKYIGFTEIISQLEDELIVISVTKTLKVLYEDDKNVQRINYLSSLYRGLKALQLAKINGNKDIKYSVKYYDKDKQKYTSIKMIKLYKSKIIQIVKNKSIEPKYYKNYIKELENNINSISEIPIKLTISPERKKSTIQKESELENSLIFIEDNRSNIENIEEMKNRINIISKDIHNTKFCVEEIIYISNLEDIRKIKEIEIKIYERKNFINEPVFWTNYNKGNYILPETEFKRDELSGYLSSQIECKFYEDEYIEIAIKKYTVNLMDKINYYQWLNLIYKDIINIENKTEIHINILKYIKELEKRELKLKDKKPIHIKLIKDCNILIKNNIINAISKIRELLNIEYEINKLLQHFTTTQLRVILDIYTAEYKNRSSKLKLKDMKKIYFENEFTFLNEKEIIKKCIE